MKYMFTILISIIVSSCVVAFGSKEQKSTKYIVQKCFEAELLNCPDKLCETSNDNIYEIIQQIKINVLACVEESENETP